MARPRVRLLIFIHELAPYGAQRVALGIAENLDRAGFELKICSFGGDETLVPAFEACGAEVTLLRAGRYLDLSAWRRFARYLIALKPDIVQTNLAELSVPVRLLSVFLPGLKIIHTVQNPLSSEPFYWRALNRLTMFLCDLLVFCSESMHDADRLTRLLAPKTCVIRNGIDIVAAAPADGAALRRELGIPAAAKVVCCVGRLVGQKGQDIMIEAMALLSKRGRELKLLLAGDGETLGELRAQASRLGLEKDIHFLGRRSDVARIISACDVYAAPSRWEGLNIALAEAMLCGVPCAATGIAGHADIFKDGETGLAVPPEDPEALAQAITRLLDEPEEASRLAAAAGDHIRASFQVGKMAGAYQMKYLEVLGTRE